MEELEPVQLSDAERSEIRCDAKLTADYEILSRHVRVTGNSAEIIQQFDVLYEAFRRVRPPEAVPDTLIEYRVTNEGLFTVSSAYLSFRSASPEIVQWPSIIFSRIILHRIHSHYLVHAGCVARDGQAIVIAGASGMGKTTLVAHLAAQGFEFLSDEFAAICRSDGFVDPYPMRLGLRPGPGHDLLGEKASIELAFRNDRKKLADIETLSGREPARRAALRAVVFFTTDLTPSVTTSHKRGDRMKAWFTVWNDALAEELAQRVGATVLSHRPDDDMTEVTMSLRDLTAAVPVMRDLARRHGGLLAQIQFEDLGAIDRTAEPHLLPIPASTGVIELIKKVPAISKTVLIENVFGGKAAAMIMDLTKLVNHAAFYKLTPGRLNETIALMEKLVP